MQLSVVTMKAVMANYYHEARAHARSLKNMQEENKRRAERRAEVASVQVTCVKKLHCMDCSDASGSRLVVSVGFERACAW